MSVFTCCPCGAAHLNRVKRSTWMRLFFWLRAYQCGHCGKVQLLSQRAVNEALAAHASKAARHPGSRPGERKAPVLDDVPRQSPDMN